MKSQSLEQHNLPTGTYGYSATGLDELGATEYTLVTIVVDVSGSVYSYKKEMEDAILQIVDSCKYSPRADNLMIRLLSFNNDVNEIHGFKLLEECDKGDYDDCLTIRGSTALYDASHNAINATIDYGMSLVNNDFDVNAIIAIITDGMNNTGKITSPKKIKEALQKVIKEENLESLLSILIGVGTQDDPDVSTYLSEFKDIAGITQYVEIKNANARELAKLAEFVSKSISAQSQALGSGSPSQPLQF